MVTPLVVDQMGTLRAPICLTLRVERWLCYLHSRGHRKHEGLLGAAAIGASRAEDDVARDSVVRVPLITPVEL